MAPKHHTSIKRRVARKRGASANTKEPAAWLFVTGQKYYLDEDGAERADLEPSAEELPDGDNWWTCNRETKLGDRILVYRKTPKKDIRYLFIAATDAFELDAQNREDPRWRWACGYVPLFKFDEPLSYDDIGRDPILKDWPAYRKRFQGATFKIDDDTFGRLLLLLSAKNPAFRKYLAKSDGEPKTGVLNETAKTPEETLTADTVRRRFTNEKQMEDFLFKNPGYFKTVGIDLDVSRVKRQFQVECSRIDLCAPSPDGKTFYVIELKHGVALHTAIAQVALYIAHFKKEKPGVDVQGIIVSRRADPRLKIILKYLDVPIRFVRWADIKKRD